MLSAALVSCSDPATEASKHAAAANQALQVGRLPEARKEIQDAIDARDDLPELFLLQGRIEFAAGAEKQAFSAYANALALDAANIEALQAVSQLGLRTNNLRDSLDATNRLLVLKPDDPDTLVVRGVHAFLQHRFEEAISYANRSLASQPQNESATILKSRALYLEGKPSEALQVISSRSPDFASSVGVYRTKLELYREMHDPKGMQEQFDALKKLAPDDANLRIDEGDLHYKVAQPLLGRVMLASVLASPKASQDQAQAAVQVLEAYNDTLTSSQVAAIAATGSAEARAETSRWAISVRRPDLAEILVNSLSSEDRQPLMALVQLMRGETGKALVSARDVLNSDQTNCDALNAAAGALLQQAKPREALVNAQRAAAECPTRADPWLIVARAYAARGEAGNVERAFRDGLDANPQSLLLTRTFGDWLMAKHRAPEAQAVARLLTRKAPALVEGWVYYRALCSEVKDTCDQQASQGLKTAKMLFGPDPDPRELPQEGLFGRLTRR